MKGFEAYVKDFSYNRIYSKKYIRTQFLPILKLNSKVTPRLKLIDASKTTKPSQPYK